MPQSCRGRVAGQVRKNVAVGRATSGTFNNTIITDHRSDRAT